MSSEGQTPTLAEQTAAFKTFATTDGEISAGGDHPEETAAAAAREQAAIAARTAAHKPQPVEGATTAEGKVEQTEPEASGKVTQPDDAATQAVVEKQPKPGSAEWRKLQLRTEIKELVKERTRAIHEFSEEQARLKALKASGVAPTPQGLTAEKPAATEDPAAPKPTDFEFGELDGKYVKALARYEAKKEFEALKAEDAKQTQQAAITREQAENRQKLQDLTVKGAEKYDDFEELVIEGAKSEAYPISEVVGRLILGSDVGPDIAYHLASNPKEARELAGKPPLEQAAYFGRLEARFSAPASGATATKVAKTTQAPPPIRSAKGGGGSTQTSPATNDFAAFERMAREAQK